MLRFAKSVFPIFIVFYLFSYAIIYAQCNQNRVIAVCSLQSIDFDSNGSPDGIINLYQQTGTTAAQGEWTTMLETAITLDSSTGNVYTWELRNSSIQQTDYIFELRNSSCGDQPFIVVNLILGPYSGVAITPDADDINLYLCDQNTLDLSSVLIANESTPVAHINGTWTISNNGGLANLVDGKIFSATVPYQPGLPRVDQDVYELVYTVPGISPCLGSAETRVKVAVVRQVDAGEPILQEICESSILNGDWDADVNANDFLEGEDIEGFWNANTADVSKDLILNIKDLYDQITDNGNTPNFGCRSFTYEYTVEKRSVVCSDASSSIKINIYEQLRDFNSSATPTFCPGASSEGPPLTIDLFDYLQFETGHEYASDEFTHWEFVSGPSDLGLVSKRNTNPNASLEELRCVIDPAVSIAALEAPYYTHLGTVNLTKAAAGDYVFRYYVCANALGCNNFCPDIEKEVTIQILETDYAGEDTAELKYCLNQGSLDLRSALLTNNQDDISTTGIWTDPDGNVVPNIFEFPDTLDQSPKQYNFTYTTTHASSCTSMASLSFEIFEIPNAGENATVTLCQNDLNLVLFDQLGGNPTTNGIWKGPFGYQSDGHLGTFDTNDLTLPVLGPGDYIYEVAGNESCMDSAQATVTVNITIPSVIGEDRNESFCATVGSVNLFSLLDRDTPRTGVFEDIQDTNALSDQGMVSFDALPNPDQEPNKIHSFRYTLTNAAPCEASSLLVNLQITNLLAPVVSPQEFCVLDAARLDQIVIDAGQVNWYDSKNSNSPILGNPLLVNGQKLYVATTDANNCESERTEVAVKIINLGEQSQGGAICALDFQDGVSADGNGMHDTFAMARSDLDKSYNIPEAFPDFKLKIYNRYGSLVFKGNKQSRDFEGRSNISTSLGDDLPSGVYFYVFEPNFKDNKPIQGSFYLSR